MNVKRAFDRYSVSYLIKWITRWSFRILTGHMRLMPDFLIIGAQRCGTTSLYNYLVEHPNVVPAFRKEAHFFDIHFNKGTTWYRSHFPLLWRKYYANKFRHQVFLTGEASPYYIFHPHAPRRSFETVPRAKLIALLRNPVDRAYSHYHHEVKMGVETLSFDNAIEREKERLPKEMAKMLEDEGYSSFDHQNYSYLSRGIYVDQLRVWASLFPKDQILVLKSEAFYDDPSTTTKQVLEFMNLPDWSSNEYKKYKYGNYPRLNAATRKRLIDYHERDASTTERLIDYFKPHNQRLYEYLGVDLGWDN